MSLSPVRWLQPLLGLAVALAVAGFPGTTTAETPQAPPTAECCRHEDRLDEGGLLWTGSEPTMTIERLAAYAAPVLWFSPDEPLLKAGPGRQRMKGKDIMLPEPFPFEEDPGFHQTRLALGR